jgi:tRNA threonylcarbamoyladenosine biosynthesis protein TsaB
MKTLALEFSSDQRSVAVAADGVVLGRAVESGGRESHPIRLIESALAEAGLQREEIQVLALGLGPGSYYGVRSAIALAQGWQLAQHVRLCGVSSADAIAGEAWCQGRLGRISVIVDAHRDELYLAGYDLTAEGWRETEPLRVATPESAHPQLAAARHVVGPEAPRWWATADVVFPTADAVARIAADRSDSVAAHELEPLYLRPARFVKAPPPRAIPGL